MGRAIRGQRDRSVCANNTKFEDSSLHSVAQWTGVYKALFMAKIDFHQTLSVISTTYLLLYGEILGCQVMRFRQYM